jgi:hypothetical protein
VDGHAGAGAEDGDAGPDSGDVVLEAAVFVKEGDEEREAAEGCGDKSKEWRLQEIAAEPAEKWKSMGACGFDHD